VVLPPRDPPDVPLQLHIHAWLAFRSSAHPSDRRPVWLLAETDPA
jgi:hypothetical protein